MASEQILKLYSSLLHSQRQLVQLHHSAYSVKEIQALAKGVAKLRCLHKRRPNAGSEATCGHDKLERFSHKSHKSEICVLASLGGSLKPFASKLSHAVKDVLRSANKR